MELLELELESELELELELESESELDPDPPLVLMKMNSAANEAMGNANSQLLRPRSISVPAATYTATAASNRAIKPARLASRPPA